MPEIEAIQLISKICDSISYLISQKGYLRFGNLKLENLFLDERNQTVRLSDYQLSYSQIKKEIQIKTDFNSNDSSDIYMLGVIALQIICRGWKFNLC